jgi:hypothetical protein
MSEHSVFDLIDEGERDLVQGHFFFGEEIRDELDREKERESRDDRQEREDRGVEDREEPDDRDERDER